jgi:hypothetical protein
VRRSCHAGLAVAKDARAARQRTSRRWYLRIARRRSVRPGRALSNP